MKVIRNQGNISNSCILKLGRDSLSLLLLLRILVISSASNSSRGSFCRSWDLTLVSKMRLTSHILQKWRLSWTPFPFRNIWLLMSYACLTLRLEYLWGLLGSCLMTLSSLPGIRIIKWTCSYWIYMQSHAFGFFEYSVKGIYQIIMVFIWFKYIKAW